MAAIPGIQGAVKIGGEWRAGVVTFKVMADATRYNAEMRRVVQMLHKLRPAEDMTVLELLAVINRKLKERGDAQRSSKS